MANAASQHEQVPDAMAPWIPAVQCEKNDARCVKQTAGEQPTETARGQAGEKLTRKKHAKPAHQQIDDDWQDARASTWQRVQNHAENSQAPDQTKHPPALTVAQRDYDKRRVGSGNQEVDCLVVNFLQELFGTTRRDTVIQRRGEIQDEQGRRVDRVTHDLGFVTVNRCRGDQRGATNQRERRANKMTDAIESLAVIHA